MIYRLIILLIAAGCVMCTSYSCEAIEGLTLDEIWALARLSTYDRYFILTAGSLSVLLMLATTLSWLVYRSFNLPSDILFVVCLAQLVQNSAFVATAIYQSVEQFSTMPPTFDSFCSTIGIFVVVGNASSLYYNTTLCIVMAISVRNTLKKSLLSPIKYHGVTIFIVVIATLTIILTQNFGEGFTGLCGYKLASKQSVGRFIIELITACACIFSMLKFRNKIPRNTYFLQQAVFGFYFYYMGIFCAIQCGTSLSFLVANILCRIESGPISIIGYAFSIGNSIQIMLSYVLFVLRFSHPILQLRLRKIFGILRPSDEETDGNRNDEEENSWVGCLIESIKGSQILSFLSAITIGFIQNENKVPKVITPYHYQKHYTFILNQSISDEYVTRRVSNRESLLMKQKMDGLRTLDYEVTLYTPAIYTTLLLQQRIFSLFQSFDIRKNIYIVKRQSYTNGGKSGQFFFGTHDNVFIFKTICAPESQLFVEKTQEFKEYFQGHADSLIVKILGLYRFRRRDVKEEDVYLMLMQNLTRAHKRHNLRVYDIKGSQFNRSALEEHKVDSKDVLKLLEITLKDKDFMEIEGKVEIAQSVAAQIKRILERDIRFLAKIGVMDYSLLIIKREGQANPERGFAEVPSAANPNEIYNFGIIDYLEPWNLKRKAERAFKTMITDQQVTASSPEAYSQRLIDFINSIM